MANMQFLLALLLAVLVAATASAQQAPRMLTAAAIDPDSVNEWATRASQMLRDGRLDIVRVDDDTMLSGRRHERLAQRYEGLPVFGAELVRQMDGREVRSIVGHIYDNVAASTKPVVQEAEAVRIATTSVGATARSRGVPMLGVLPTSTGFALVWRIDVRSAADQRRQFVNAATGVLERSDELIWTQSPQGVVGIGTGVLGDQKKVSVARGSGGFQLHDQLRPASVETYDFGGDFNRLFAFFTVDSTFTASDYGFDADNVWSDGALVDAHDYLGWTYDFYFKQFGRKSWDDQNHAIQTIVHPVSRDQAHDYGDFVFGQFVDNAGYFCCPSVMVFGDGDGTVFTYFSASLDVTAHEYTHGVTDYTSELEYHDQSGALNESFSDIMGTAAEFFFGQQGVTPHPPNWLSGEDIVLISPGYGRSLAQPTTGLFRQPDHFSLYVNTLEDSGGVHINSGIPNHAFYLAVHGGTNRVSGLTVAGVGDANIDRVAKIFYRAFTFFLTPTASFSDARNATLQAATELYGGSSNERQQVQLAWDAVGVR